MLIVHNTKKDLKNVEWDDIDKIVGYMHTVYKNSESKYDFIKILKNIYGRIFYPKMMREEDLMKLLCLMLLGI